MPQAKAEQVGGLTGFLPRLRSAWIDRSDGEGGASESQWHPRPVAGCSRPSQRTLNPRRRPINRPRIPPPILHQQAIHPQIRQGGGGMSGSSSTGCSASRDHPIASQATIIHIARLCLRRQLLTHLRRRRSLC
ncbi:hypothetical protein TIFTF001_024705 [Ficus carica]|uniref:Uncharacterized protein n=1 Tax=Ficus carica TaxID=3494 RepID=A0AA88DG77_FICCA|nr:hypothetical protein TIFTF001_024705 [Ficus carica]